MINSTCPECGARFSPLGGGHCQGGRWGGCCRTFSSDQAAEAHRVGPHLPGRRRCLSDLELAWLYRKDGSTVWRLTSRGWTNSRPRPMAEWHLEG